MSFRVDDARQKAFKITLLPVDITELVFEFVAFSDVDTKPPYVALILSHVCRHFRSITLDHPMLWSAITSEMHPRLINACVERSGGVELEIEAIYSQKSNYSPYPIKDMMESITATSPRWRIFTLEVDPTDYPELSSSIFSCCSKMEPSSLRSFSYIVIGNRVLHSDINEIEDLWAGRPAPKLNTVLSSGCWFSKLPTTVREYTVHLSVFHGVPKLILLLSNSSSLHTLRVVFASCGGLLSRPEAPVVVANVKKLSLERLNREQSPAGLKLLTSILETLRFPNLTSLTMTLRDFPGSHIFQPSNPNGITMAFLDLIFLKDGICQFPSLEEFSFSFSAPQKRNVLNNPLVAYAFPFGQAPRLRHLRLEIPGIQLFTETNLENEGHRLPALASLQLENCDAVDDKWLFTIIEKLRAQGDWEEFEKLSVINCRFLDKRSLDFVEAEKLHLVECEDALGTSDSSEPRTGDVKN